MEHAIIQQVLQQVDEELEQVEFLLRTARMPLTKDKRDVIVDLMTKALQKEKDALQQLRILREFEANTISEADLSALHDVDPSRCSWR
jgi:hypothetical protein